MKLLPADGVKVPTSVGAAIFAPHHHVRRASLNQNVTARAGPGFVWVVGSPRVCLNGVFNSTLHLEALDAKKHTWRGGLLWFFALARTTGAVGAAHG